MDIRSLEPGQDAWLARAGALFDQPIQPAAAARFLEMAGHHVLIATIEDEPVGFVTGVEMTHPDKGTEMFLYELGVSAAHRGHGIGTALVEALRDLAGQRGCYGMWVMTDEKNEAALSTYERAGAGIPEQAVVVAWDLVSSQRVS